MRRIANIWVGPLHQLSGIPTVLGLTILALLGLWWRFPSLSTAQRAVLIIPLMTYSLTYYFVAYMPRYRMPNDWILLILAGAAVWTWLKPKPELEVEPGQ